MTDAATSGQDRTSAQRSSATDVDGWPRSGGCGTGPARVLLRIVVEETLKRFPTWEVDRAVRQHTSTVRGYSEVHVRL